MQYLSVSLRLPAPLKREAYLIIFFITLGNASIMSLGSMEYSPSSRAHRSPAPPWMHTPYTTACSMGSWPSSPATTTAPAAPTTSPAAAAAVMIYEVLRQREGEAGAVNG